MIRPKPSKKVIQWIKKQDESNFFISVLTLGEIHKGIEKLPASIKKEFLCNWVENDLKERFRNRVLDVDTDVAMIWGKIQGLAEKTGRSMPAIDSLIAATGITHHLTVVTRNGSDMEESGAVLFDPWE